jgi:predicted AAA+ superfamily ATPase
MKNNDLYPRYLQPRVIEALADSPVVLIHGPRQCGKTTLARQVGDAEGFAYLSFDDDVQRAAAHADPVGYVADLPQQVILDEVQRVPELFTSLKAQIDARRKPGRFILTGSANVLLYQNFRFAGRPHEMLRLHPLRKRSFPQSI